ncbi:MAG: bifunctional ADP-heptose synthase [Saprospiraceae bacterium]|nr:bifunctional ADP-heptose synthase [Saprospiraceae bacterium]
MYRTSNELNALLDRFKEQRILVVGDVMIDKYLLGSISRMSPEAPVPVMQYEASESRPGGAANVALNVDQLGAQVTLCSVIGQDPEGTQFMNLLAEYGLNSDGIIQSAERITTTKTRVMAESEHLLRVDREVTIDLTDWEADQLLARIQEKIEDVRPNAIILQDYNKGVLSATVIKKVCQLARVNNIKVSVDPKFDAFLNYRGVDLFKPNLIELRAGTPYHVDITEESLAEATNYVREQLDCALVLVTLSDEGIFVNDGKIQLQLPAHERVVRDVCGAGDSVISVATLTYVAGYSSEEIAYWSNLGGSIICEYPGVVPLSADVFRKGLD